MYVPALVPFLVSLVSLCLNYTCSQLQKRVPLEGRELEEFEQRRKEEKRRQEELEEAQRKKEREEAQEDDDGAPPSPSPPPAPPTYCRVCTLWGSHSLTDPEAAMDQSTAFIGNDYRVPPYDVFPYACPVERSRS